MSKLNLEQQRKRAKELVRAHHNQSLEAAVRVIRNLPRARNISVENALATPLTLIEAQLIVAREAGFPSWPKLKHHLEEDARTAVDWNEAIIDAAFRGDDTEVRRLLDRHKDTTKHSIYAAAAVVDAEAMLAALQADRSLADRRGGRREWTPLLYLCCSMYRRSDPEATAMRLEIIQRLVTLGVDVNARGRDPGFTSDSVSRIFDDYEWTPIEGAAGRLGSPELVKFLIGCGAAVLKTAKILTLAVRGGNLEALRMLLDLAPRDWFQIIWALQASVVLENKEAARMLSAHAESPTMRLPAIREGIRLQRDPEIIGVVLRDDKSELAGPVCQAAYRDAILYGQSETADLLRKAGANPSALSDADRLIGDCMTGRRHDSAGFSKPPLSEEHHLMLSWAIRNDRHAAVPLLLEAGVDPNVPDTDGELPLHLAVQAGSEALLHELLAAGSDVNACNFESRTALEVCLQHPDIATRERMTKRLVDAGALPTRKGDLEDEDPAALFERAADAVAFGDLDALRKILDEHPAIVHARSPRPHRCTLLNYCGANGTEDPRQRTPKNAPQIAQLLLERGADPNATCKLYGGGATTMGLMLSSMHPQEAGLSGELARVLLKFGVRPDPDDFMCTIEYGLTDAVAAFVEAGVAIDNLFIAGGLGRVDILEKLLSHGIDINTRYRGYGTALHAAAGMNHKNAVMFLLERGADMTLHNTWGALPEDSAWHCGHRELATFIHNLGVEKGGQ